jgi:regulation of enolase protein 1 (concanavalin A-like superfamily)
MGGGGRRVKPLTIEAGPRTDLFRDPQGADPQLGAPRQLVDAPDGDWTLSARVSAQLAATFDAGALLLWVDERTWAKLAFERSPAGEGMVVSVVTRGLSDDCNSVVVDGDAVWLRIARVGEAFAFHASDDGERWDFVRHFALDGEPQIGFLAQSPTGDGCSATFDPVRLQAARLRDLRSGE